VMERLCIEAASPADSSDRLQAMLSEA
jgi:hypothetical protein